MLHVGSRATWRASARRGERDGEFSDDLANRRPLATLRRNAPDSPGGLSRDAKRRTRSIWRAAGQRAGRSPRQARTDTGAEIVQPPTDMFRGDRTVILKVPSGHIWVFLAHIEDVSDYEVRRRLASAAG